MLTYAGLILATLLSKAKLFARVFCSASGVRSASLAVLLAAVGVIVMAIRKYVGAAKHGTFGPWNLNSKLSGTSLKKLTIGLVVRYTNVGPAMLYSAFRHEKLLCESRHLDGEGCAEKRRRICKSQYLLEPPAIYLCLPPPRGLSWPA